MALNSPLGYQPNIVVINTDDAPLDCYATGAMPLLEANWFPSMLDYQTNGSCNTPLCLPGRAATLTGLRVEHHRGFDNSSGANLPLWSTFLVALKNAGYYTGAVGKWINGFGEAGGGGFGVQKRQPGLDFQRIIWGNPNYFGYQLLNESGALTSYGESAANGGSDANYATDVESGNVLAFLAQAPTHRPFALYWGSKCPHKDSGSGPTPAPRHAATSVTLVPNPAFGLDPAAYGNPSWMSVSADTPWDAAAIAAANAEHILARRALLSLDEAIHAMLTALQTSGRLASTLVFLKTDNAHSYGEMRQSDKGTPHRGASSMMLKVRQPSGVGGTRTQAVSDIDIAPTICELAAARMPWAPDGQSFYRTFASDSAAHRVAAPMSNPTKDSPTFEGLWYATGRVYYEGLPGGKAANQQGCWTDYDMTQDRGPQPDAAKDLRAVRARNYAG